MTTEINIEVRRGDTRRKTFVIKDADGTVENISAWTSFLLTVQLDKKPTDNDDMVAQFNGALSTDGTDGRVHFSPDGTEAVGKYYYDVQAIDANSEKITIAEGVYEVVQDRTKD